MPLHALPPASISSLTSTQTLTWPPSLLKELVENAIDARSTVIAIEISANCVDLIQVRDNGHGILPGEDREHVARRWWTSKIAGWEDLSRWRGHGGTLGFRGEALASAAEMSSGLSVGTRVEGERVGWVGEYDRAGKLVSQSTKSLPVGTTVRIKDFLKRLPVRREAALKSISRHQSEIRKMLIKYALSHPNIRFSLKIVPGPGVVKTKMEAGDNWVYSPSKTVQEAVMKIFGKEMVAAGVWVGRKSWGGGEEGETEGEEEEERNRHQRKPKVEVEAFLIKPGIDPSTVSKAKAPNPPMGHYISVDSRPISCDRGGPFKSLLNLYKSYIKSALSETNEASSLAVTDPFIYLHIRCRTPGLYDPNIEPAKDDVLFRDWDKDVMALVEGLFKEVYGELKAKITISAVKVERPKRPDDIDFSVLLARKPAAPSVVQVPASQAGTDRDGDAESEFSLPTMVDERLAETPPKLERWGDGEIHGLLFGMTGSPTERDDSVAPSEVPTIRRRRRHIRVSLAGRGCRRGDLRCLRRW
ncbi:histidine kinase-like ATPase [Kalaharituber pfeilii]|nr:histidine kinase-like ATPase [Kalaharituber pfeilii]